MNISNFSESQLIEIKKTIINYEKKNIKKLSRKY